MISLPRMGIPAVTSDMSWAEAGRPCVVHRAVRTEKGV